jgi:hypothetical protein
VLCVGVAILFARYDIWWVVVLLAIVAAGCLVDLGWVVHRKRRGEPG